MDTLVSSFYFHFKLLFIIDHCVYGEIILISFAKVSCGMNAIGNDEGSFNCGFKSFAPLPLLSSLPSGGAYTIFNDLTTGLGTTAFFRCLFCNRSIPIEFGDGARYTDLGGWGGSNCP